MHGRAAECLQCMLRVCSWVGGWGAIWGLQDVCKACLRVWGLQLLLGFAHCLQCVLGICNLGLQLQLESAESLQPELKVCSCIGGLQMIAT